MSSLIMAGTWSQLTRGAHTTFLGAVITTVVKGGKGTEAVLMMWHQQLGYLLFKTMEGLAELHKQNGWYWLTCESFAVVMWSGQADKGAKTHMSGHSGMRRGVMNHVTYLVFLAHCHNAFFLDSRGV